MWLLLFGVAGQFTYEIRSVYQLVYSYRRKESILPLGHWVLAVMAAFIVSAIRYRLRLQIRSHRMGFRLYGMAEDPIWLFSKGSSTCRSCCSRRRSFAIR